MYFAEVHSNIHICNINEYFRINLLEARLSNYRKYNEDTKIHLEVYSVLKIKFLPRL